MWTLSHSAEKMLNACEKKALRKICGILLANGQYRNRCNNEIYNLYKEMELTRVDSEDSNGWAMC